MTYVNPWGIGNGWQCTTCGRWVGSHEYHVCPGRTPVPNVIPTTTVITRPAPEDQRLRFALELIEGAADLTAAKRIAAHALGRTGASGDKQA